MKIARYCIIRADRSDDNTLGLSDWVYCIDDREDTEEEQYYAEFGSKKHAEFFLKALNSGKIR